MRRYLPDPAFQSDYARELHDWVGRPTALSFAPRLSERWGARIYLKREDLAHTGAHKINNAIGQALLARKRLGVSAGDRRNRRRSARRSVGRGLRRGLVCPAASTWVRWTWSARRPTSIACSVLEQKFVAVESGDQDAKSAAIDEALARLGLGPGRYRTTCSALPSGRSPYPYLVRELQSDDRSAKPARRCWKKQDALPDAVFACVGGGSNAIGLFYPLVGDARHSR